MEAFLKRLILLYQYLLRLYPRSIQEEFAEEMLRDFSDLARDASNKGFPSLLIFCLRELVDYPASIICIHLREGKRFHILRSQPVDYGLRGAMGFGVGFAAAAVAIWGFSSWLTSTLDSRLPILSVWIFDTFHNENGMTLLWNILSLISAALTGLVFGLLFAVLAGRRTKYSKYTLAGALAWFIPFAISSVLSGSFGWSHYLSTSQSYALGIATNVLVGAFFGAIVYIAESNDKKPLQLLAVGSILYLLIVYLYTKMLFYVWMEITPWFFPVLMALMILLLGSVFALVRVAGQKKPWAIVVGALAYPVLNYSIYQLAYTILRLPTAGPGEAITQNAFLLYEFTWAGVQAFLGLLFGLLLGLVLGIQDKPNLSQLKAGQ